MKEYLLLCCYVLFSLSVHALPLFEDGKKYRIVCDFWGEGSISLGSNHGSSAYVYYDADGQPADDHWWYIRKDANGYTISNAQNGTYLTYDPERIDGVAKGLINTSDIGSDRTRWIFIENQGAYNIVNVDEPTQWFNVRLDGSNLVGTYAHREGRSSNECFRFYDEDGNLLTEGIGCGITAYGEYWENICIDEPVVYTTDIDDPILYTIKNVRSNLAVSIEENYLYLKEGPGTRFYFIRNEKGVNVYSEDHRCVTDYFSDSSQVPLSVDNAEASSTTNCWSIGYSDQNNMGYYLCKESNLSTQASKYKYWNDYSRGTHFVGLFDLDHGSTFIFASADQRHIDHLARNGVCITGNNRPIGLSVYVDSIRINNKDLVYDQLEKVYYFHLPKNVRDNGVFVGVVTWNNKADDISYLLHIGGVAVDKDTNEISLTDIDATKDYTISLIAEDGALLGGAKLRFSYLPLVEVNVGECYTDSYTTGTIRVTDSNNQGRDSIFIAAFRHRGASASFFEKKSYAIKMYDAEGNSVDRQFLGLREDNNWILDAMAIDRACMRNRVATDLWNDFATKPYHQKWEKKALTGTRGKFVEVFLNGKYNGLYCMTEKIDRKQLKLKKLKQAENGGNDVIRGSLFKSYDWTYETLMGHYPDISDYPKKAPSNYNNFNKQEAWCGYELKYPDYEDEPIDWAPLWNAINFVSTSSDEQFVQEFADYFDRPVVDDYYLFMEIILASDNHGKNMYYFNYDQLGSESKKIGIAPWDLDGTWGRRWDGTTYYSDAKQDFMEYTWAYEHGLSAIFDRLYKNPGFNWYDVLRIRYKELRQTYFDPENLKKRFAEYGDLFSSCRADRREEKRWNNLHSDIQGDVSYIQEWIDERIAYLDTQYDIDNSIVGIDDILDKGCLSVKGGIGCIIIRSTVSRSLAIYDISGRLVHKGDINIGITKIEYLSPGVYFLAGEKILVK